MTDFRTVNNSWPIESDADCIQDACCCLPDVCILSSTLLIMSLASFHSSTRTFYNLHAICQFLSYEADFTLHYLPTSTYNLQWQIFVVHEHAMHAKCDSVMANPSVLLSICLSVCVRHTTVMYKRIHILANAFHHLVGEWPCFEHYSRYKTPVYLMPLTGGVK